MLLGELKEAPVLLIDANAMCHKAKHTTGTLTNENYNVGIIFGFFNQILKLAKDQESNQFCFTWDSLKSHREKLFPEYKEKRRTSKNEKTPEEKAEDKAAYAQFDRLYESILPAIGFKNNFKISGYEGDDLIASVIDTNYDTNFRIVSGDEDMYQCLCDGVDILNSTGVFTKEKFIKEYGIHPAKWVDVKAIAGCTSDEVPGVKGIGEKRAIDYILNKLTPNLKTFQSITCPEGKRLIARNRPLVELPFKGCPPLTWQKDEYLNLRAFTDMCAELSFLHFLKKDMLQQWKQYLNLR